MGLVDEDFRPGAGSGVGAWRPADEQPTREGASVPIVARANLSPAAREEHLARLEAATLEHPLDVLVVGGGATGAGAAFDAASRGLDVGLIEAGDLAGGTSSRSSKLMHGGLRYLQMLDFKLVAEALRERDLLLTRTAPHLVTPVSFVFPFARAVVDRAFIGSGVALYDTLQSLGRRRAVPLHRHLLHDKLMKVFPALDGERIAGAVEYHDAQVDDARLVMMLARSAALHDAAIATYTRAIDYVREEGRVIGVKVRDEETGHEFYIHARETILAAGVWTQEQQEVAEAETGLKVLASKGIHITVAKDRIPAQAGTGIITQTEKSVLFLIPCDEHWIIGTTDTPWTEDVSCPAVTAADIEYVLEHANAILASDLTREDVIGTYAGLRPLLQPVTKGEKAASASTKVSREHTVMTIEPGLTAIAGGKLTTYRVMAEDVVDHAIAESFPDRPSLTASLPIIGAQGHRELTAQRSEIARIRDIDLVRVDRLLHRYGSLLPEVTALIDTDPSLGRPLEHDERYLRAEVVYAVRAEGARHVADVLIRRTRSDYEVADRGAGAAAEVAALMAPELGWDAERETLEAETYRAHIAARLAGEQSRDDATAAAALAAAPEVPRRA